MKTLIFNGSPRPQGDTAWAVARLRDMIPGQHIVVEAYRCHIAPCLDCRYCKDHPGCAIQDDMQAVYAAIQTCDNIVIASPVYFSELTGRLLDVASRLQTFFCARFFRDERPLTVPKKGAVLLVGGGNGAMAKAHDTASTLLRLMNCSDIHPLVSSGRTDTLPAREDPAFAAGIQSIADFFTAPPDLRP